MHLDLTTLRAYWRADLKAEGDRIIAALQGAEPDPSDPEPEPDPEPAPELVVTAEPSADGTTALVAWETEDTPSAWRTARDGVDSHGAGPWSYDWPDPAMREILFTRLIPGREYTFTITNVDTSLSASVTVTMPVPPQPEPPTDPSPEPEGNVVWRANIDGARVQYRTNAAAISGIFGPTFATSSGVINNTEIVTVAGQKVMRQHLPAGSLGSLIASPKLPRRLADATISFDLRLDPGMEIRHGFKAGAGLVGIRPGAGIYDPTSGKSRDTGASLRIMVHGSDGSSRPFQGALGPLPPGTDNEVVTYIYARNPDGSRFSGFGHHAKLGTLVKGQWHNVKIRGRMNTPGKRDGVIQFWLDGDLRFEMTDADLRGSDSSILWDAVLWDTHRGGGKTANWLSSRPGYLDLRNVTVTEVVPPKAEPEPTPDPEPAEPEPEPEPVEPTEHFTIRDGRIYDPAGNEFIPLGMNIGYQGTFDWRGDARGHSDDALEWGFNTVKTNFVSTVPYPWDYPAPLPIVDEIIREYTAKGIVVQIVSRDSLDRNASGNPADYHVPGVAEAWRQLALKYADNPYVWFNLSCEPHEFNDEWVRMHQTLIDAVRSTGAKNPIIIDPPVAGQDVGRGYQSNQTFLELAPRLENHGGIINGVHTYGWPEWQKNLGSFEQYVDANRAAGYPVMVGEAGFTADGTSTAGAYDVNRTAWKTAVQVARSRGIGIVAWHGTHGDMYSTQQNGNAFWEGKDGHGLSEMGRDFRDLIAHFRNN